MLINGGTPWHSENDGHESGLDADLLDGKHSTSFLNLTTDKYYYDLSTRLKEGNEGYALLVPYFQRIGVDENNYTSLGSARKGVLRICGGQSESQIVFDHFNGDIFVRGQNTNWTKWRTVAFTDSSVESAVKLKSPVSLWGNSFDGSSDIKGSITSEEYIQTKTYLRVSDVSNRHRILIGNQDSLGTNKPCIIQGVNGILSFGMGDTWTGDGGTIQKYITIDSDKIGLYNAVILQSKEGSWMNSKSNASLMYNNYSKIGNSNYHPILGLKTYSEHVISFGAISDSVGFFTVKKDRTVNGNDYYLYCDVNSGNWKCSNNIEALNVIKTDSSDDYVLLGGGGHKALSDFTLSDITIFNKTLEVTQDWMDTGIKHSDLTTGTYIVQVYVNAQDSTGNMYDCYWSGVVSWYSGKVFSKTNDNETDEIILHRSGHAYENTIYLRTIMSSSESNLGLRLQIASNKNIAKQYSYKFTFKKII